jgi:hypothetical protein
VRAAAQAAWPSSREIAAAAARRPCARRPSRRTSKLLASPTRTAARQPYSADYVAEYCATLLHRLRATTAWVKSLIGELKERGGSEIERSFVTHRTGVDLRGIDLAGLERPQVRRELPGRAALYERKAVLVRPDGMVAWRGDTLPEDIQALLDTVRGARM